MGNPCAGKYIECKDTPAQSSSQWFENAIVHGISMKKGYGMVTVVCGCFEGAIQIVIQDDGVGIDQNKLDDIRRSLENGLKDEPDSHVGLKNVNDRIRLYYEGKGSFAITSREGCGTLVKMAIPAAGADAGGLA